MPAATHDFSAVERFIRRDRFVTGVAVSLITLLSWAYLVRMARAMQASSDEAAMHAAMGMAVTQSWGASEVLMLFLMWTIMMAGMMLPSAAPVILLVIATYRRRGGAQAPVSTAAFTTGYLAAWGGFSAIAAVAQAGLHAAALMSPSMATPSLVLAGVIFLAAGAYQWTPWKNACLSHCRSPLHFLSVYWREGASGAFGLGLRHGLFCVGCCWALMLVLFAAGVMNLLWVAAIAALVLIEKMLPAGPAAGRVAGTVLIAWGAYLLVRSL